MRAPRFVPPGSLVEITVRTNGARFYLRPGPELNAAILGIVGRALALYPVSLHAIVFLSNHWHALVTPCDGEALARFLQYVNANVAKAAQAINGVRGIVWQRRASLIHVLDEEAQLERLRYLLAHGTKERLVASPRLWPGVTSARSLAGEEVLVGVWEDRALKRRLERGNRVPHPSEYTIRYPIEFVPLPVHATISDADRQREINATLAEVESAHPGPHLGVSAVLAQDPNTEPVRSKHGRAPAVHTTSDGQKARYLALRAAFREAYRSAAARHAERPTAVAWPVDAFLPALQFVVPGDVKSRPPMLAMIC